MELEIIRAIQQISNPFFDIFFQVITASAEQIVLVLVFCAIYWLFNKELGEIMGMTIVSSLFLNNTIKVLFDMPRPIGEDGIRSLRVRTATGSSFPSGHTQGAAASYSAMALGLRRRWISVSLAVLVLLVGISRLYLGVHYPKDVLAGLIFGIFSAFICRYIYYKVKRRYLIIVAINILMLLMLLFAPSIDGIKSAGLAFGLLIGFPIEKKYIAFNTNITNRCRLKRYAVGIGLVMLFYIVPKFTFSPDILFLAYLRYAIVSFTITVSAPLSFKLLKI